MDLMIALVSGSVLNINRVIFSGVLKGMDLMQFKCVIVGSFKIHFCTNLALPKMCHLNKI